MRARCCARCRCANWRCAGGAANRASAAGGERRASARRRAGVGAEFDTAMRDRAIPIAVEIGFGQADGAAEQGAADRAPAHEIDRGHRPRRPPPPAMLTTPSGQRKTSFPAGGSRRNAAMAQARRSARRCHGAGAASGRGLPGFAMKARALFPEPQRMPVDGGDHFQGHQRMGGEGAEQVRDP